MIGMAVSYTSRQSYYTLRLHYNLDADIRDK
jgi:hypothetical protein